MTSFHSSIKPINKSNELSLHELSRWNKQLDIEKKEAGYVKQDMKKQNKIRKSNNKCLLTNAGKIQEEAALLSRKLEEELTKHRHLEVLLKNVEEDLYKEKVEKYKDVLNKKQPDEYEEKKQILRKHQKVLQDILVKLNSSECEIDEKSEIIRSLRRQRGMYSGLFDKLQRQHFDVKFYYKQLLLERTLLDKNYKRKVDQFDEIHEKAQNRTIKDQFSNRLSGREDFGNGNGNGSGQQKETVTNSEDNQRDRDSSLTMAVSPSTNNSRVNHETSNTKKLFDDDSSSPNTREVKSLIIKENMKGLTFDENQSPKLIFSKNQISKTIEIRQAEELKGIQNLKKIRKVQSDLNCGSIKELQNLLANLNLHTNLNLTTNLNININPHTYGESADVKDPTNFATNLTPTTFVGSKIQRDASPSLQQSPTKLFDDSNVLYEEIFRYQKEMALMEKDLSQKMEAVKNSSPKKINLTKQISEFQRETENTKNEIVEFKMVFKSLLVDFKSVKQSRRDIVDDPFSQEIKKTSCSETNATNKANEKELTFIQNYEHLKEFMTFFNDEILEDLFIVKNLTKKRQRSFITHKGKKTAERIDKKSIFFATTKKERLETEMSLQSQKLESIMSLNRNEKNNRNMMSILTEQEFIEESKKILKHSKKNWNNHRK